MPLVSETTNIMSCDAPSCGVRYLLYLGQMEFETGSRYLGNCKFATGYPVPKPGNAANQH